MTRAERVADRITSSALWVGVDVPVDQLAKILQRDLDAGPTWFTGPGSFTAHAARDRRVLLSAIEQMLGVTPDSV